MGNCWVTDFITHPGAAMLLAMLGGIAVAGGMFVVPLYAFLTTFVEKSQTARTIAANNIVNSGAMVVGAIIAAGLSALGVLVIQQLLLAAAMCLISAWLALKLCRAGRARHDPHQMKALTARSRRNRPAGTGACRSR
jgi:MFS family permease